MTNELRATKVSQLAKFSPMVEGRESVETFGRATLKWPHPKVNQYAVIDTNSGDVIEFIHQSGAVAESVSPHGWLDMIDRRIKYLSTIHREQIKEASLAWRSND